MHELQFTNECLAFPSAMPYSVRAIVPSVRTSTCAICAAIAYPLLIAGFPGISDVLSADHASVFHTPCSRDSFYPVHHSLLHPFLAHPSVHPLICLSLRRHQRLHSLRAQAPGERRAQALHQGGCRATALRWRLLRRLKGQGGCRGTAVMAVCVMTAGRAPCGVHFTVVHRMMDAVRSLGS